MNEEGDLLLQNFLKKYLAKGNNILEFGSGSCFLLKDIVNKYGADGIGIDPYGITLNEKNLRCFSMSAEDINKLNIKFDIIFGIRSFHHISNYKKFLKNSLLSLQSNGKLIIVDWKKGAKTGINEYYFSLQEIEEIVKKIGYKVIEQTELQNTFGIVCTI